MAPFASHFPGPGYAGHVDVVKSRTDAALAKAGFDRLLVASGIEKMAFLDDMPYPFKVNAQFKAWVPLVRDPNSWIAYTPGKKPVLVHYQPDDYWHVPPSPPSGEWVDHFDVRVITDAADAAKHLPGADTQLRMKARSSPEMSMKRKPVQTCPGAAAWSDHSSCAPTSMACSTPFASGSLKRIWYNASVISGWCRISSMPVSDRSLRWPTTCSVIVSSTSMLWSTLRRRARRYSLPVVIRRSSPVPVPRALRRSAAH
jgi:hypothetical protein